MFVVGAGMLSGLNASWSFCTSFLPSHSLNSPSHHPVGGAILAWGIIAPSLVKSGLAFGVPASSEFPQLISYTALSFKDPEKYVAAPSPRYWLLWPGVLIMLLYSFADIAMSAGSFVRSIRENRVPNLRNWFSSSPPHEEDSDPSPPADRIPTPWWTIGLSLSIITCTSILATQFHMNVGEALLALVLGFAFSFIGVQSSGHTDVNPVSTVAKVVCSGLSISCILFILMRCIIYV
jgi:hypothetical protein